MFEIGQKVKWQTTPKTLRKGKIVFVVPAGQSPTFRRLKFIFKTPGKELREFIEANIFSDKCNSALSDGSDRNHESYLVEVASKSGRGKPKVYWPRVSALKPA